MDQSSCWSAASLSFKFLGKARNSQCRKLACNPDREAPPIAVVPNRPYGPVAPGTPPRRNYRCLPVFVNPEPQCSAASDASHNRSCSCCPLLLSVPRLAPALAMAQNLGTAPAVGQAVQGQTAAQPEGAFLNLVNWVGNVICPVGGSLGRSRNSAPVAQRSQLDRLRMTPALHLHAVNDGLIIARS